MSKQPGATDPTPCVGCGLCCDGTLFLRARALESEEKVLKAAGLEVIVDGDKRFFRLPCHMVSCGQCTNYENRYDICRTFTCKLYRRTERGEISLEDARADVAKALQMRAEITAKFPDAGHYKARQELRAALAETVSGGSPSERQSAAKGLLSIIAFDEFLERRFRNNNKTSQPADGDITADSNS